MKPSSHGDYIMIALCSFYAAVFIRVCLPGAPLIAYIAVGAALYCATLIGTLGAHRLRKHGNKPL